MKLKQALLVGGAVAAVLCLETSPALAQTSAFTYQGRLTDNGLPANGSYDFQFGLYASGAGGSPLAAPLSSRPTQVSNGLFTVTLDFGAGAFDGAARWLEVAVRTNGSAGAYSLLNPRQELTATPYALRAAQFSGPVADAQLSSTVTGGATAAGAATSVNSPGTIVKRDAAGGFAAGAISATSLSGNGSGLTGLDASQLTSGTVSDARLSTNVALLNGNNLFTGTSTFAGVLVATNANSVLAGAFSGNGSGLNNLDLKSVDTHGLVQWATNLVFSYSDGFAPISTNRPANPPYAAVAADVNRDGKMDLVSVCGDFGVDTLTVLTNDGTGVFVPSQTNVVGWKPVSVTAADVNGDGWVDLITANNNLGNLTILTNDGHGGFVEASSPDVGGLGSYPSFVTAVDVNRDGKMDLVCAIGANNTLLVLTNDGGGGFAAASSVAVGNNPVFIATADVNGDGAVDLISANQWENTLTVLTNDGHGVFAVCATIPVDQGPTSLATADVNHDGAVDLICANLYSQFHTLTVLTNDGRGGFATASTPSVDGAPVSVVAGDVNQDGWVDLISANQDSKTFTVLTNDGLGGFAFAANLPSGAAMIALLAADVNGDQRPDLVSVNLEDHTLTVFSQAYNPHPASRPGLDAGSITTGTLPAAQLPSVALTNNASGVNLSGSFVGDGSGLTNVSFSPSADVTGRRLNIGSGNTLTGSFATIAGGANQTANASYAAVGGGAHNTASANQAVVAGGYQNTARATAATVAGGSWNEASGVGAFVGGGGVDGFSAAGNIASGAASVVAGGLQNTAGANYATVGGGFGNTAAGYSSFAAGFRAKALHHGAFVWSAPDTTDFASTTEDQFLIRAPGGVGINTNDTSGATLTVAGTVKADNIFQWQVAAGTAVQAQPNRGYVITSPDIATVTLPASATVGDTVRVTCPGGGWKIAQNAGQSILVGTLSPFSAGLTWSPCHNPGSWVSVACTGDGSRVLVAGGGRDPGELDTSTDGGATWSMVSGSMYTHGWQCVACSANGRTLMAGGGGFQLFVSKDWGTNWAGRAATTTWYSAAASADGTKLIAAGYFIYTSTNSGVSWTQQSLLGDAVASSADGTKLVAAAYPGQIYTSADTGETWTPHESERNWSSVASSADGSKLVAVVEGGQIYTSTDSGATWTPRESNRNWVSVASSADGCKLIAADNGNHRGGRLYTSTDSGLTWAPSGDVNDWSAVASTTDGQRLVATVWNGDIYVSTAGSTTAGTAGGLSGGQRTAIELQYIGNNQFLPISHEGTILGY